MIRFEFSRSCFLCVLRLDVYSATVSVRLYGSGAVMNPTSPESGTSRLMNIAAFESILSAFELPNGFEVGAQLPKPFTRNPSHWLSSWFQMKTRSSEVQFSSLTPKLSRVVPIGTREESRPEPVIVEICGAAGTSPKRVS